MGRPISAVVTVKGGLSGKDGEFAFGRESLNGREFLFEESHSIKSAAELFRPSSGQNEPKHRAREPLEISYLMATPELVVSSKITVERETDKIH
jgi:hypothetical protein